MRNVPAGPVRARMRLWPITKTLARKPKAATHWSVRAIAKETGIAKSTVKKSQIQALDREQPVLPMMPGVPERRTNSYVRHGTTSLFAALDVASGFVIGKCYKRHRAVKFLKFLKEIDAQVPEDLDVHIVMDNYAAHKTPTIKAWFARRPLYHVHFTPTSASWINQVERWSRKQIQRGVHTSVRQLKADIRTFIDLHNQNPKPFK
jgi:transposase